MINRGFSEQIAAVRRLCQNVLARKSFSTGIASTESFLLLEDRLWGIRFSLGCFHAKWQIGRSEILLFENQQLIGQLSLEDENVTKAA